VQSGVTAQSAATSAAAFAARAVSVRIVRFDFVVFERRNLGRRREANMTRIYTCCVSSCQLHAALSGAQRGPADELVKKQA
jgi:predicted alpha/beta-hydrolase family hydrolase